MQFAKSIAFFIPHLGCPHKCTFCDQRTISHTFKLPDRASIVKGVETAMEQGNGQDYEIAYFGGSFTCMSRDLMRYYLEIAADLIARYGLRGVRISTRPDGINEDILYYLKKYNVTTIELGAQSMNNGVLKTSSRGHTAEDTERASELIQDYGINLVLQMMAGMPGDTPDGTLETAKAIAELHPGAVRIYPLLVIKGTELEKQYEHGTYTPLSLEEAVSLSMTLVRYFKDRHIPIIKLGLHSEQELENGRSLAAGPYHPAFRELVEGRLLREEMENKGIRDGAVVLCNPKDVSKVKGHRGENERYFIDKYGVHFKCRPSVEIARGKIEIEQA
ncbi:MAG: radical SAM protein [Bacillota bacterium]|nr:radical SAM protein [Bacillota bacterium]